MRFSSSFLIAFLVLSNPVVARRASVSTDLRQGVDTKAEKNNLLTEDAVDSDRSTDVDETEGTGKYTLVPKHIKGTKGDTPDGKPDDAIGYVGEAGFFLTQKQFTPEKFPLNDELKAKGISEEDWGAICKSLAKGKGKLGFGSGFKDAIKKANEDYFDKIGCLAVYAEYGLGNKAMVVFEDKEKVIKDGRVKEDKPKPPPSAAGALAGAGIYR